MIVETNLPGAAEPVSVGGAFDIDFGWVAEGDGTYSAFAMNLPGAGSCGDTPAEAVENAGEAAAGVIEEYLASGQEIPWVEVTEAARATVLGTERVTIHV